MYLLTTDFARCFLKSRFCLPQVFGPDSPLSLEKKVGRKLIFAIKELKEHTILKYLRKLGSGSIVLSKMLDWFCNPDVNSALTFVFLKHCIFSPCFPVNLRFSSEPKYTALPIVPFFAYSFPMLPVLSQCKVDRLFF
jgi:hypothetical protein